MHGLIMGEFTRTLVASSRTQGVIMQRDRISKMVGTWTSRNMNAVVELCPSPPPPSDWRVKCRPPSICVGSIYYLFLVGLMGPGLAGGVGFPLFYTIPHASHVASHSIPPCLHVSVYNFFTIYLSKIFVRLPTFFYQN